MGYGAKQALVALMFAAGGALVAAEAVVIIMCGIKYLGA